MSEETRRYLKSVVTRHGIMYVSCKVHKKCVDDCLPFKPVLFALQTPYIQACEGFRAYFRAIY